MIYPYDFETWPRNLILTSRHHWFQLQCHHLSRHQVIINSNICVTIFILWLRPVLLHHCSTRLQPIVSLKQLLKGLISRSTPIQNPVLVAWEGSSQLLLIKVTGRSYGEWWAGRLAGRSISLTLKDINIGFNHLPYYSIGRGDGRIVTDKQVTW